MPLILSITSHHTDIWTAGPEGLFRLENGELQPVPQPHQHPACCCAVDGRMLIGGSPYGVAFSPIDGQAWQASWMDGVAERVIALSADPRVEETGVVLAGSEGGGILRTVDRGQSWSVCNYGLHSFQVLALAWAPVTPTGRWPTWEYAFAATDEGVYRSPNGGRAWKRAEGIKGYVQTLAVAPDFQHSGLVLAGTEDVGLWRSTDGGRSFAPVAGAPAQINALAAGLHGWLLSDASGLWRSRDGASWVSLANSRAALTLLPTVDGFWAGDEEGVVKISLT